MEITQIPTGQLVPHANNAHTELRGIDELAATVEYLGIIEPLVVLPADDDGTHTIIAGHRRHAAALQVELKTVPCIIAADRDAADQIVIMLVENLHRDDLTLSEEAKAYEQLALLDWEPERIASATGRDLDRVQQSLTLRKLPEQIQQAAGAGEVDLVSAAALTEFAHDPKAIERILKKGSGHWGYQHAIADERRRQKDKDAIELLKAELVIAGVKVTARPNFVQNGGTAVRLEDLVDAQGNPVDVEEVKARYGFAAYINRDYQPKAVHYCIDPAAVGLHPAPDTWEAHQAARDERDAEAAARRAAREAATEVRRAFLIERFASAKAAKQFFKTALREVVSRSMKLPVPSVRPLADAVAGCPIDELPASCGLDRLNRATVARWLGWSEDNLNSLATSRWGDPAAALGYLDLLVDEDYELADIEAEIRQQLAESLAEADNEDEDEDDEQDEDDDPQDAADEGIDPAPAADGDSKHEPVPGELVDAADEVEFVTV